MSDYDVIIIGTGTAGTVAADDLLGAGKKVAIVDQGPVGGTCALRGCQPKKVFAVNTQLVAETQALVGSGIGEPATINWGALQRFKRTFTDPIPEGTTSWLEKSGADVFVERASVSAAGEVDLAESGRTLRAPKILIANGARPRELTVSGAELAATSTDFLDLEELPESMIFIGGGYISMEFAFMAAIAGSSVTVLQRGPQMLPQFSASLVNPVLEAGEARGISFVTGASVSGLARNGAGYSVSTEEKGEFSAAWVMAAIGRAPNIEGLGLDAIGVDSSGRGIKVNEYMETTADGIYAAGDCVATKQLSPVSDMEARIAAANIVTPRSRTADYDLVPTVVFTYPQMASVGPTPEQARAAGREVTVNSGRGDEWASARRVGSPVVYYETVADAKSGRLLGAHIAGPYAGEQINVLAAAIRGGMTADEFRETPWAYPTHASDLKYMV